jgi:hypothetical protein
MPPPITHLREEGLVADVILPAKLLMLHIHFIPKIAFNASMFPD